MFKLQQRKATLEKINKISNTLEHVLIIHYSCESFFNIKFKGQALNIYYCILTYSSKSSVKESTEEELRRLRKENRLLKQERDILKRQPYTSLLKSNRYILSQICYNIRKKESSW